MTAHYTAHCSFRALFSFCKTRLILSILSWLFFAITAHAQPNFAVNSTTVLVSIKPLHSLISHITDGVNPTLLLLPQQQTPHDFQLRPSQKRLINQADIFFYSHDNIETFVPALKRTHKNLTFVELSRVSAIDSLPVRQFHFHSTHAEQNKISSKKQIIDGHIWLSIQNAKVIAETVTQILSIRMPEYAEHYQKNLTALMIKLEKLQQQNKQLLQPYKTVPYLVYHDAFQYFEKENNLNRAHFITTNPEHSPGIKRVQALREIIRTENIQCIFYEPPNKPALLNTLTENSSVNLAELDPVGTQIAMGKSHYFELMRQTATTLKACFSKKQE